MNRPDLMDSAISTFLRLICSPPPIIGPTFAIRSAVGLFPGAATLDSLKYSSRFRLSRTMFGPTNWTFVLSGFGVVSGGL